MNRVFAILPCYNEAENIEMLIDEWRGQKDNLFRKGYDLQVVGIDDCSEDQTRAIIARKSHEHDDVTLLPHDENKGLAGGLNSAISYFLDNGRIGDLMIIMDGDNTHDPIYANKMISSLIEDTKDCVIASRYRSTSSIVGVSSYRKIMSDAAKLYYSAVLSVPNVRDYTCGYRVYSYEIIEKLVNRFGTDPIKEKSFACMMELLYKLHIVGARFGEVGFELRYDKKGGGSKMRVLDTMKRSLTTALKLRSINRTQNAGCRGVRK